MLGARRDRRSGFQTSAHAQPRPVGPASGGLRMLGARRGRRADVRASTVLAYMCICLGEPRFRSDSVRLPFNPVSVGGASQNLRWLRPEQLTCSLDTQTLDTLPSSTLEESASLAGRQPSLEQPQRRPRNNRPPTPHPSTGWILIRGARHQPQREEAEGSPVVPHSSGYRPRPNITTWSAQPGIRRRKRPRRAEEVDPRPELPQGIPTMRANYEAFVQLMDDSLVRRFLKLDKYFMMSDKYMLSMVVVYFIRAARPTWQFKRFHFFLALYLANGIEQNVFVMKKAMLPFAFRHKVRRKERNIFRCLLMKFFEAIGGEAWVSPEECEEIMDQDPFYWGWCRDRILFSTPVSWGNEDNRVGYGGAENLGLRWVAAQAVLGQCPLSVLHLPPTPATLSVMGNSHSHGEQSVGRGGGSHASRPCPCSVT
ncbi:uncharacterized protein LOC119948957 [Tachyglossus aculeatus]|uniref:uncharacterized protein LOC119948957 n=1 Tax=Tachyglossus aculeatus TaxID=9261 RepID=UPI0018F61C56|nr:uncharacterized protein LOC119948957 [Tachyglossus aculeatus]